MNTRLTLSSLIGCLLLGISICMTPVFGATAYSTMTNEQLSAMRGTMRDAPVEEQEAFRAEWQERIQNMTIEERRELTGRPESAPRDGSGSRHGRGTGSGGGNGHGRR